MTCIDHVRLIMHTVIPLFFQGVKDIGENGHNKGMEYFPRKKRTGKKGIPQKK